MRYPPPPPFFSTRPAFVMSMDLVHRAAQLRDVDPWRVARRHRAKPIAITRFGVVWVMRLFGVYYTTIASLLAFNDHTSVIYAERRANELRATDPAFLKFTDDLLAYALTQDPQGEAEAA